MRRSDIHNHAVVEDSTKFQCPNTCPNFTVINNKDLVHDFGYTPGLRVGMLFVPDTQNGFDANFLYLWPWHSDKRAHGDKTLSFPFDNPDYAHDYHRASHARARYESAFWSLEANYWRYITPRYVNFFSLSGIAGLRYFHLDEEFKLTMTRPPDKSSYRIHTWNNMTGVQLGLDFQMNPTWWLSWEAFAKVGLYGNYTEQRQHLRDRDNRITLRHSKRHVWACGGFTDVAAQATFQFFRPWNLYVGYQVMCFSALALAPEQVSRGTGKNAGKKDYTHGNAIIDGVYAGLMWKF
jgi:hypothetical protein